MASSSSSYATWQRVWDESQSRLSVIRQSLNQEEPFSTHVTRVGKLDAELLDQELVQVLQDPLQKALSLVNVRENIQSFTLPSVLSIVLVGVQGPLRARVNPAHPTHAL